MKTTKYVLAFLFLFTELYYCQKVAGVANPAKEWNFNQYENAEGWLEDCYWLVRHTNKFTASDGLLNIVGSPNIFSPSIKIEAGEYRYLGLRMRINKIGKEAPEKRKGMASIYWQREDSPGWDEVNVVHNIPVVADGKFHIYSVDLSKSSAWKGKIIQVRLNLFDAENTDIDIDFVRLAESESVAAAAAQEIILQEITFAPEAKTGEKLKVNASFSLPEKVSQDYS